MRYIALDTETTGLNIENNHRIIEIGCTELISNNVTGRTFHRYINPQRQSDERAIQVHGIKDDFLLDKPLFSDIVEDFHNFIQDSGLIIHNASFDLKFLNFEFAKLNLPKICKDRKIIDTLLLSKKKFPGSPASLDAICKRFNINTDHRTKHGALIDAELLALVYIEMSSDKQHLIQFGRNLPKKDLYASNRYKKRIFSISHFEEAEHQRLKARIGNNIWDIS